MMHGRYSHDKSVDMDQMIGPYLLCYSLKVAQDRTQIMVVTKLFN